MVTHWRAGLFPRITGGVFLILALACACQQIPAAPTAAPELIIRSWEDDIPADLFSSFTQETGIQVRFEPYETQEKAVAEIEAGKPADVVVVDSRLIPGMIAKQELKVINRSNVPNFRYISAGFRGLAFDPNNQYSIPYQWGTAGIVYRRDTVGRNIENWKDLWDPEFRGKVGLWKGQSRDTIGLTLKMLGFSANSENPEELAAAMAELNKLAPDVVWVETIDPYTAVPGLLDGRLMISMGYAYDAVEGRNENPDIQYVLPAEGAVLWGEHFVIPASTLHGKEAELLLNYLLTPEVMAKIVQYNYFAVAHDGAMPLISQELREDPLIFPPENLLTNAEIVVAVSEEAENRFEEAWEAFISLSTRD